MGIKKPTLKSRFLVFSPNDLARLSLIEFTC